MILVMILGSNSGSNLSFGLQTCSGFYFGSGAETRFDSRSEFSYTDSVIEYLYFGSETSSASGYGSGFIIGTPHNELNLSSWL